MTQADVAKRLGVQRGVVSNWERRWGSPSRAAFELLVELFGKGIRAGAPPTETGPAPSSVGQWLRKAREGKGWTQAELAKRASLSSATLYYIESGKTRSPSGETIAALEKALGDKLDQDAVRQLRSDTVIEGVGEFLDFDPHDKTVWPTAPGVYVFYDISDRPIYVGKSGNIGERLQDHEDRFWFKRPIVQQASYVTIGDETLRKQVETLLIRFLKSNAVLNIQNVRRE